MRESKQSNIDGITVTVVMLPAKRARNLLRRIMSVAAPAVTKALGNANSLEDIDLGSLSDAATLFFDRLPEEALDAITDPLLEECTLQKGDRIGTCAQIGDELFAGKLLTLGKVIKFALEVNYGDFLGALKSANLGALLGAKPSSTSPTT